MRCAPRPPTRNHCLNPNIRATLGPTNDWIEVARVLHSIVNHFHARSMIVLLSYRRITEV